MRALIINSMFVNALYRRCADELGKIAGLDLTVLTTDYWMMNGGRMPLDALSVDAPYRFVKGKAIWRGKENRSFYTTGLVRALRVARPDVIFMMEEPFSLFTFQLLNLKRLIAPEVPVVFFTWNNLSLTSYDYRPSVLYRTLAAYNLPRMQHGLTANLAGIEVLREFGYTKPVTRLGYGVDTSHYASPRPEVAAQIRERLNVERSDVLIGYVGRLLHMKGVDLLLEGVATVLRASPDLKLKVLVLGSGEEEVALQNRAKSLGLQDRVSFVKTVAHREVPDFMHALDILVLPSRRVGMWAEQFGRVLVEAMAAGKIVLGAESGAIPEVIGNAGFVFRENDSEHLAIKLQEILSLSEGEKEHLSQMAQLRASQDFGWSKFAQGAHAAMQYVIEEGRATNV
jgi:L-malate glycosyltransferase